MGAKPKHDPMPVFEQILRQDFTILPTLSIRLDLPLDERVVMLTLASGLAVGALLAVGPALWSTRLDLAQTLRDGSRGTGGAVGLSRARRLLVAAQVAISLTLLVAAALFTRSVSALTAMEVGFPREGLIALDFDLEPAAICRTCRPWPGMRWREHRRCLA